MKREGTKWTDEGQRRKIERQVRMDGKARKNVNREQWVIRQMETVTATGNTKEARIREENEVT